MMRTAALTALVTLALVTVTLLALAIVWDGTGSGGVGTPTPINTVTLALENEEGERVTITAEIADSPQERATGLMNVAYLDENYGMLFVFGQETKVGFWMKDTKIPLSIAFVAGDGTILETQDMAPLSRELHRPAQAYRYALEVNQGWFARHGLGSGDRVDIPADVTAQ